MCVGLCDVNTVCETRALHKTTRLQRSEIEILLTNNNITLVDNYFNRFIFPETRLWRLHLKLECRWVCGTSIRVHT